MTGIARLALLTAVLSGTAFAEAPAVKTKPKITTKTTALYPSKQCKTKIKAKDGSDPVLRCPSLKGYDVEVSFSATDTLVTISGDSRVSFMGLVGDKLEWQLVDGKPFAILVEIADSGDTDENGHVISTNPRIELFGIDNGARDKVAIELSKPKDKKLVAADTKKAWTAARALAATQVAP